MSGPGTRNTVGKVGVRVVPDTDKFYKEVKAYLDSLEGKLKVKVHIEFDEKQALAEWEKLKKTIEKNAEINVPVKYDSRGLQRASSSIRQMQNPLASVEKSFKNIAASVTRFGNNVVETRQRLAGTISDLAFWVRYTAQTRLNSASLLQYWQKLSKAGSEVAAAFRRIPTLAAMAKNLALSAANATKLRAIRFGNFVRDLGDAQTYVNAFYRSMEFVGRSAERVANRVKNLKLSDVTQALSNGFRRVGTSATTAAKAISRNFGRAIDTSVRGLTRGLSKGIAGFGSAIGSVGSSLASFGSSLMSITRTGWIFIAVLGLAAPLVGVLAAAIAALPAAIAVAGAGIGVIMLGLDGIKKAAEAAKPAFEALKKTTSETFTKELTPIFKEIGQKFLPGITKGVQAVAKGISDMAKGFTDVITSKEGMAQINVILANTAKFFSAMRPTIQAITQWFLKLAEVGSAGLANMANSIGAFFRHWNALIDSASQTGVLQQALAGLGQVLGSVGQLFLVLFKTGLDAMAALGGPMSNFIMQIGNLLGALMPILTVISKLFFEVGAALLNALVPVVTALTPAIQKIGELLGTFLVGAIEALIPIIVPLAQIFSEVLLMALKALEPLLPPLIQFMQQLGQTIGQFLLAAFTAIQPLIQEFLNALSQILVAVQPLMPVLLELVQMVLAGFLDILEQLMPTIMDLAVTVFPLLVEAAQVLVPALADIVRAVIPIIPELVELAGVIIDSLIPFMELLMDVVQEVWPSIRGIIEGAMEFIKGVINLVMGIIRGDWSQAWEGIKQILSGAWEVISNVVKGAIKGIVAFFKGLPGAILEALGNLGRYLFNAGESLVQGLWDGIKAVWNKLKSWVSGALESIRNLFPFSPAKEGPFSGKGYTLHSGRALAQDWAQGIRDGIPEAQKAVEDMMKTSDAATSEWSGVISSDGFGSLGDSIREALESWGIQIDGNGLAKIVNKANFRKDRRG